MMTKIRPHVMASIGCATTFSIVAAVLAYKMGAVEVMTAVVGGVFGLLGGVSLRIIDSGDGE